MPPALRLLPRDELARRIKAMRVLRGIEQDELGALFEADGLGKGDPGRLERGDERVTLTRARLDALVRHLRVPERWFTSDDVDELVGFTAAPPPEPATVEEVVDQMRTMTRTMEELLGRLGRDVGRRGIRSHRVTDRRSESNQDTDESSP